MNSIVRQFTDARSISSLLLLNLLCYVFLMSLTCFSVTIIRFSLGLYSNRVSPDANRSLQATALKSPTTLVGCEVSICSLFVLFVLFVLFCVVSVYWCRCT